MAREVMSGMAERLRSAAASVEDARTELRLSQQARDRLIVEAVDGGMTQRTVARLVGTSQPYVIAVLSRSDPLATVEAVTGR